MGGAGGSLRAGVTENPVLLTRSVKDALTKVTCGGAPVYIWPGGGITLMVDVTTMPDECVWLCANAGAGGANRIHHAAKRLSGTWWSYECVQTIDDVLAGQLGRQNDHKLVGKRRVGQKPQNPWPLRADGCLRTGQHATLSASCPFLSCQLNLPVRPGKL